MARPTPVPQADMANSTQQLNNVMDAFEIRGEPPVGPVLLVDDTVDSRWTSPSSADSFWRPAAVPHSPSCSPRALLPDRVGTRFWGHGDTCDVGFSLARTCPD
jgi:hypothetical protein